MRQDYSRSNSEDQECERPHEHDVEEVDSIFGYDNDHPEGGDQQPVSDPHTP